MHTTETAPSRERLGSYRRLGERIYHVASVALENNQKTRISNFQFCFAKVRTPSISSRAGNIYSSSS
jgi:hypothetical protein